MALLAFLLAMALMIGFLYQSLTKSQFEQLKNEVTLIAKGVELNGEGYLKQLDFDVIRITLITKDGQVVYDSLRQAVQENHLSRDEVQQAQQTGYGESIRYSKTLTQKYAICRKTHGSGLYSAGINCATDSFICGI